jgi:hypothetical protein
MTYFSNHLKFITVLIGLVCILNSFIHAAEDIETQLWGDGNAYYRLNDIWQLHGELGGRTLYAGPDWSRIYIHPSVIYQWQVMLYLRGGIRIIYTDEVASSNAFELRPWQGLRLIWPRTSYLILDHYLRLEERFTFYTESDQSGSAMRLRYRIRAKSPNLRLRAIDQTFYLLTSYEFLFNLGVEIKETFANRNRLTFGLGYFISQSIRTELHYTRHGTRDSRGEGFKTTLHVFRLRLRYYLN